MFNFKFDHDKKVFIATISGYFTKEEGNRYVSSFLEELKTITPSNYALIVDSSDLLTTAHDALDDLKACLELYAKLKFKKIIFVMPRTFSVMTQALDVENQIHITANHVSRLQEAYNLI